ncbi:MAG TPA: acyl-CoA dehydrogenase family protein [Chitinophagales bacterium]|nr:acyl-CoA dehydrogenase family protein [Chitinophagales bacterium]
MNSFHPFTEEHELLRQSMREFIRQEIIPYADEWEANKECPRHIFERMGELGFMGVTFPEEYGGSAMDLWSAVVIAEELAHSNAGGLAMSLYAHTYLPLPLINAVGTEEQKMKYLAPALKGEKIAALAITEPGAGSDVGGIKTFAKDMGDHFVVNGSKMFITNGTMADFVVTVVRHGDGYNMSVLIIDTNLPGFKAIPVKNKLGMHTSDTGQLFFEDCKVPKSALLGHQGNGFYYIMNNLQEERLIACVMGAATGEWALTKAITYAKEREAFGRPIGNFQVIRHKMAKMAISIEACRSFAYRAVQEFIETGPAAVKTISMAKAFICDQTFEVVNEALQIHGGWGYMEDYGIARALRDVRLMTVGAGTTEVMHEIISKMVVDDVRHKHQFVKARGQQTVSY